MKYELRQWINKERTEYFVRAWSNDLINLEAYMNRPSRANSDYYNMFIVCVEEPEITE